jgi:hypothetical protein
MTSAGGNIPSAIPPVKSPSTERSGIRLAPDGRQVVLIRRHLSEEEEMANIIQTVTTKERLHKLVDELTESEADSALLTLSRSHKHDGVLDSERQRLDIDEAIVESYSETPQEDLGALWATRQSIREEPWSRNAPS